MSGDLRSVVRSLVRTVYLPVGGVFLGLGMLVPVLPLYLRDQDLSFTVTTLVVAAMSAGSTAGGLPMSGLIGRVGSGKTLVLTGVGLSASLAVLGATDIVAVLVIAQVVTGVAQSGFVLSRQTLIRSSVVPAHLGRVNALVGGTNRLSFFLGPLLGGMLAETIGFDWTFVICGAVVALGCLPASSGARARRAGIGEEHVGVMTVLRRERSLLLRCGVGPALITGARRARFVVVPLVADSVGLSTVEVGLVVAVGTGADLFLFPIAGQLMDTRGRLFAIIPSFSMMAVGLMLLGIVDSTLGVVLAGAVIGIGNGLSAGTMLTYSADLAPDDAPSQFMAALSVMQGAGGIAGTLLVGVLADAVDLGTAAIGSGFVLIAGVVLLVVLVGETGPTVGTRNEKRS